MDGKLTNMKPLTKKQDEKEQNFNIKAEGTPNTEEGTQEKTAPDDKVPRKPLGKRASKPSPKSNEQDQKKKKKQEDSKTKDMAKGFEKPVAAARKLRQIKPPSKPLTKKDQPNNAAPSNPKGPKKETPPGTPTANVGAAPVTPEGRQPPRLPFPTPARPKPVSRLIRDEPLTENRPTTKPNQLEE
nr:nucleolar protein dao-5-like [Drosophila kikkawai]